MSDVQTSQDLQTTNGTATPCENQYMLDFLENSEKLAKDKSSYDGEKEDEWPVEVIKVLKHINELDLRGASRFVKVESDYYSWPLSVRTKRVNVPNTFHMTKCVIMENKRWKEEFKEDLNNFKMVCIFVQYEASIDCSKLTDFIRSFKTDGKPRSKKNFNFRLVNPELTKELTGFDKFGVSPFGSTTALPIIMSKAITELNPPIISLGAGHPDWKLVMPVDKIISGLNCIVGDVSIPKPESSE
ncbi:hypothetical protein AX774_g1920 [Zancudomyces culisetae]|uniref:YbaK/aminoacyl-tRNA synthetase-associated domain-containing protein n=1 Tax=Zancudomyces culisetae TaxID=1213189 RepID=A0A1R1PUI0_ZANCU|nr:hypothetical protein AX774_g1920 [Zancudomyces culisetae]|eukprot:OMH84549.1 hypothetical protein AX774_g1920 [Zancudomyces culisetae]